MQANHEKALERAQFLAGCIPAADQQDELNLAAAYVEIREQVKR